MIDANATWASWSGDSKILAMNSAVGAGLILLLVGPS